MGMAIGYGRISIRVLVYNTPLSLIIRCSFDEWLENCIRLPEIVVNHVHEQRSIEE